MGGDEKAKFEENNATLGRKGERVLGFCTLELDPVKFPKGYE